VDRDMGISGWDGRCAFHRVVVEASSALGDSEARLQQREIVAMAVELPRKATN